MVAEVSVRMRTGLEEWGCCGRSAEVVVTMGGFRWSLKACGRGKGKWEGRRSCCTSAEGCSGVGGRGGCGMSAESVGRSGVSRGCGRSVDGEEWKGCGGFGSGRFGGFRGSWGECRCVWVEESEVLEVSARARMEC